MLMAVNAKGFKYYEINVEHTLCLLLVSVTLKFKFKVYFPTSYFNTITYINRQRHKLMVGLVDRKAYNAYLAVSQ